MDLERPETLREIITLSLAAIFVLSLIVVVYLASTPQATTDAYTEFYLLGTDGNASGYPTNLSVGESGTFVVGVVNHEHASKTYTLHIILEDTQIDSRVLSLEDGERWEEPVSFTPQTEGRQRLWVRLYLGENVVQSAEPYRELWLWVEVSL